MENYRIIFEVIGYVGSALVLLSFLMSSVLKLRIINSLGSLASLIYGLLVHTYPTVIMNGALLIINIIFIIKMSRNSGEKIYHYQEVAATDASLKYFIDSHLADITKFFEGFEFSETRYNKTALIYYKDTVIGAVLGVIMGDELEIYLDYTCPEYRDFSAGAHVYEKLGNMGIKKVSFIADPSRSTAYLKKMGFNEEKGIPVKYY